jgi:sugar phosphate isomerase/epimerase
MLKVYGGSNPEPSKPVTFVTACYRLSQRKGDIMLSTNRRTFLKDVASYGGAFALAAHSAQAASPDWKKQVGLEIYTVRDLTDKDFEGTLAKVAEIGYKEIEAATNYGNLEPKPFRALLDRLGLSMPSTHVGASAGPDLEKQLEGFQIMGIRYTEIRAARGAGGGQPAAQTEESIKRSADQINQNGKIARKFGMKMLIHNHTQEFQPIEGSRLLPYDVLLAGTDAALVAMQLDIGWASVAGQDILDMFKKHPGRFELWHVKDARGIKSMNAQMSQGERQRSAMLVPVGKGEIDYKPIFAAAGLAGLKHYCIEQDNAADWGDSMAAARASYQNLLRILG